MDPQPKDAMILGAIKNGAKNFGKIKKQTKLEPAEINSILEQLESCGLIRVETKGGLFGKKVEIFLTEKGEKELDARIHELKENWDKLVTVYNSGDKQKLEQVMKENKSFFPMMMFFGIIDMMMFATMFSFIGATMTDYVPADQVPEGVESADGGDLGSDGFDIDIGF